MTKVVVVIPVLFNEVSALLDAQYLEQLLVFQKHQPVLLYQRKVS